MGETVQHPAILATIPFEEHLVWTEDARHRIDRHPTMFQDMQIIIPELILDEESHHRTDGTKEATGVGNRIQRQIADDIRSFVVLAHLIARW